MIPSFCFLDHFMANPSGSTHILEVWSCYGFMYSDLSIDYFFPKYHRIKFGWIWKKIYSFSGYTKRGVIKVHILFGLQWKIVTFYGCLYSDPHWESGKETLMILNLNLKILICNSLLRLGNCKIVHSNRFEWRCIPVFFFLDLYNLHIKKYNKNIKLYFELEFR